MAAPSPLKVISAIRGSFKDSPYVYKNGSCYEFYKILRTIYPQAVPWTDIDHVWTEIDGKWYDIDGLRLKGSEGLFDMRTEPRVLKNAEKWSSRPSWRVNGDGEILK